jgi:hypothetical protein
MQNMDFWNYSFSSSSGRVMKMIGVRRLERTARLAPVQNT